MCAGKCICCVSLFTLTGVLAARARAHARTHADTRTHTQAGGWKSSNSTASGGGRAPGQSQCLTVRPNVRRFAPRFRPRARALSLFRSVVHCGAVVWRDIGSGRIGRAGVLGFRRRAFCAVVRSTPRDSGTDFWFVTRVGLSGIGGGGGACPVSSPKTNSGCG